MIWFWDQPITAYAWKLNVMCSHMACVGGKWHVTESVDTNLIYCFPLAKWKHMQDLPRTQFVIMKVLLHALDSLAHTFQQLMHTSLHNIKDMSEASYIYQVHLVSTYPHDKLKSFKNFQGLESTSIQILCI